MLRTELEPLSVVAHYMETLCKAPGEDYLIEATAPPRGEGLLSPFY